MMQDFMNINRTKYRYFKDNFKFYFLGVAIMMLSNILIMILGGSSSENETAVRNQIDFAPIYSFISGVLLAPLLEEGVFRLGFRSVFKNKVLFILASGFLFGFMHLSGMVGSSLFFLYLLSYCGVGLAFAYIMAKTNNIFVSAGFHIMHNGILISLQIFMNLFL